MSCTRGVSINLPRECMHGLTIVVLGEEQRTFAKDEFNKEVAGIEKRTERPKL